ncbi:protein of unknown function [Fulvimarina manganoxydans]|uniref:DUF4214 domain-containing protein n=1 Tax=Fulvimarina manganoxydans TaxID=937218 RepID=A0A1W2EGR9_9HYPH|nr:DUF4214 domain-containing protein [Fulvimarina manganoxydans]SMD08914.1 protein of unknown function [Fulvimarina manganoxydans]
METKYGGITFPLGDVSFADRVIAYDPAFSGGNVPSATYQTPAGAIGAPDASSAGTYVSLGAGGRLIVAFDDNVLLASGNSDPELHIFEIGPDVEDQFIEISADGVNWISVGKVDGSTDSIDIDPFLAAAGVSVATPFRFVSIVDDINEGDKSGSTVGADIDAVGAIGAANLEAGTSGADRFDGGSQYDYFDGGSGFDRIVYSETSLVIDGLGNGSFKVTGEGYSNTVTRIERVDLAGGAYYRLDVAPDESAAIGYRLYQAAFGREPDQTGLEFWIAQRDGGTSTEVLAAAFLRSDEAQALYGGLSNTGFVDALYTNVLGRDGEAAGTAFWVNALNSGVYDRAFVLDNFSASSENIAAVGAAIEDGIFFA